MEKGEVFKVSGLVIKGKKYTIKFVPIKRGFKEGPKDKFLKSFNIEKKI